MWGSSANAPRSAERSDPVIRRWIRSDVRIESNNQILAPALGRLDALPDELGRNEQGIVRPHQAGVANLDPVEPSALEHGRDRPADRLDLGQLGHGTQSRLGRRRAGMSCGLASCGSGSCGWAAAGLLAWERGPGLLRAWALRTRARVSSAAARGNRSR